VSHQHEMAAVYCHKSHIGLCYMANRTISFRAMVCAAIKRKRTVSFFYIRTYFYRHCTDIICGMSTERWNTSYDLRRCAVKMDGDCSAL